MPKEMSLQMKLDSSSQDSQYFVDINRNDMSVIAHPKKEHNFSLIWLHGIGKTGFKAFK